MGDPMDAVYAARQRTAAQRAERAKVEQAEARRLHEAKKEAHRAETRKGYPGSDAEFEKLWSSTIEPEWQRSQLSTGGVEGTKQQLLASGHYSGF